MRVNFTLGETTFARLLRMIGILPLLLVMALTACEGGLSTVRDASERLTQHEDSRATAPDGESATVGAPTGDAAAQPGTSEATVEPAPGFTPGVVTIGGASFQVEVADTSAARESVPESAGTLYVFDEEQLITFWMKDMKFPVDWVWIDASCQVVDITRDAPVPEPGQASADLPTYQPKTPAMYVLEISAGASAAAGFGPGDTAAFTGILEGKHGCLPALAPGSTPGDGGHPGTVPTPEPVVSLRLTVGEVISAEGYHTCGVKRDGSVECWGNDDYDQATPPAGKFVSVSAGAWYTCGVRREDGAVECWGSNFKDLASPPEGEFALVSARNNYICGVRRQGTVACWGVNDDVQASPPEGKFASVSAGRDHTCGVKVDGIVKCWGSDADGRAMPPEGKFASVSAGWDHTCGVKVDGAVACWGVNYDGQTAPPAGVVFATVETVLQQMPDWRALGDFYKVTGGSEWKWDKLREQNRGCSRWEVDNDNSNVGKWCGVTVANGRVTRLELAGVGLNNGIRKLGVLTGHHKLAMLGDLTGLTYLDLSGNDLSSALPPELDQLTGLTHLDLSGNAFRGDISKQNPDHPRGIKWQNLVNLVELDLSDNRRSGQHGLSGRIPAELGSLPNLTVLDLSGNNLEGAVPRKLADLELDQSQSSLEGNAKLTICNPVAFASLGIDYTMNCTDKDRLEEFYYTAGGKHWTMKDRWLEWPDNEPRPIPISQWHGVITAPEDPNKVIGLFLPNNELAGDFDEVLGVLSGFEGMKYMDISTNPLVNDDLVDFKNKILGTTWGTRFNAGQGTYLLITGEPTVEAVAALTRDLAELSLQIPEISGNRHLKRLLSLLSDSIGDATTVLDFAVEVAQYASCSACCIRRT